MLRNRVAAVGQCLRDVNASIGRIPAHLTRPIPMAAVAAPAPLTAALDPAKPHSLVSLALGDLPVEIIGSPVLRRLKLVKTLRGKHGLETEVQQFHNESGIGIRSIAAAIREFDVP